MCRSPSTNRTNHRIRRCHRLCHCSWVYSPPRIGRPRCTSESPSTNRTNHRIRRLHTPCHCSSACSLQRIDCSCRRSPADRGNHRDMCRNPLRLGHKNHPHSRAPRSDQRIDCSCRPFPLGRGNLRGMCRNPLCRARICCRHRPLPGRDPLCRSTGLVGIALALRLDTPGTRLLCSTGHNLRSSRPPSPQPSSIHRHIGFHTHWGTYTRSRRLYNNHPRRWQRTLGDIRRRSHPPCSNRRHTGCCSPRGNRRRSPLANSSRPRTDSGTPAGSHRRSHSRYSSRPRRKWGSPVDSHTPSLRDCTFRPHSSPASGCRNSSHWCTSRSRWPHTLCSRR
jgi:hypothetical protein